MNKMREQIHQEESRVFDEAFRLIGRIAIEHAKIEEMLDYLFWQLTCYEISLRRGSADKSKQALQSVFREIRQGINRAHRVMSQRVSLIRKQLAQPRIAARLSEISYRDFAAAWPVLGVRILDASKTRRNIIHSVVDWSDGQLARTIGGVLDGQSNALDLKRDEAFLTKIQTLFVDVTVFTQDLGHFLPYAAYEQIIVTATMMF